MKHCSMFQEQLAKVSPEVKLELEWSSSIVKRIDEIMAEKGMTQRELARLIGCNETQIVRWTRGFPNLTLSSIARLSVALGEDLINVGIDSTTQNNVYSHPSSVHFASDTEGPSYGKPPEEDETH